MQRSTVFRDAVTPAKRHRDYVEAGHWDQSTLIKQIDHWSATTPERIAVVDLEGQRRKTFRDLQIDSCRVAGLLASLGIAVGDVVAVQMPNWYETVAIGFGVLRLGAVINPLVPVYGAKELRHMLDVGQTRVIVTPDEYRSSWYVPRVVEATHGCGRQVQHLILSRPSEGSNPLEALVGDVPSVATGWYANAADISELLFTSGTEALPKAILHTEQTTNFAVRTWSKFFGLTREDVVWMPMPIGHSTGYNYGVRLALYHGLKLVLQDRWNPEIAIQLCQSERVTCTSVAPTFLLDMLSLLRTKPSDLSHLRYFGCAGAPIPDGVVEEAARFGITVSRGYGSTETLSVAKHHPDFPEGKRTKTDGRVMPEVEIDLRREDRTAGQGQEGELFVRSPACCVGFAPAPGGVSDTMSQDGWIRTGDLGVIDDEGFLTVVGRKKEIIIRGGMNITPREVEESLLKHPSIEKVAVFGIPDQRLGEVVCACVVAQPGANLDFETVMNHLKRLQLAPYKLPSRIEFVESLPTTETGKVTKPALAAWMLSRPISALS
jgi:acyl-coenzyme A synthetase/AMP-(fatty) acid ligase